MDLLNRNTLRVLIPYQPTMRRRLIEGRAGNFHDTEFRPTRLGKMSWLRK
jgi:hypothetical protein